LKIENYIVPYALMFIKQYIQYIQIILMFKQVLHNILYEEKSNISLLNFV